MSSESKKAVIETEVIVPEWSGAVLINDRSMWLADWLDEHFDGHWVLDEITYEKVRITFEVM